MSDTDEKLLREMIGQSGEMWMLVRDRLPFGAEPIVICCNPERAYYLTRVENYAGDNIPSVNGWIIEERPLRMRDAAQFFAEFGSSWVYWSGAIIKGAPFRAFIKNGRQEGWSISLDMKTDPIVDAVVENIRCNGTIREALTNI